MVAGLEPITGGRVLIGGEVVNKLPPKDRDRSPAWLGPRDNHRRTEPDPQLPFTAAIAAAQPVSRL